MTHAEALRWLFSLQSFGVKLGLENIRALLTSLGHPELRYPSLLVTGTNGKGSVSAMLAAALGARGLRTGLYTSPHLVRLADLQTRKNAAKQIYDGACKMLGVENDLEKVEESEG